MLGSTSPAVFLRLGSCIFQGEKGKFLSGFVHDLELSREKHPVKKSSTPKLVFDLRESRSFLGDLGAIVWEDVDFCTTISETTLFPCEFED